MLANYLSFLQCVEKDKVASSLTTSFWLRAKAISLAFCPNREEMDELGFNTLQGWIEGVSIFEVDDLAGPNALHLLA
jgi:hypothetical protein